MKNIQRIADRLREASDLESFWDIAHQELEQFGVSGIFYGRLASPKDVATSNRMDGLTVPKNLFTKCSYAPEYLNAFDESALLENDPTVSHCLESSEVLVWRYDRDWVEKNPWYCRRYEIEMDLGYHKGCTVPSSHFSNQWVGGMGLAMTDVPERDFGLLWESHHRDIIAICGLLDNGMREAHSGELVGLSPRETECMTWLCLTSALVGQI